MLIFHYHFTPNLLLVITLLQKINTMTYKIVIAGSRQFANYDILKEKCNHYFSNKVDIEIVSGGAKGADLLGEQYANEYNYKINRFLPDWNKFGSRAGIVRNEEMAGYCDAVIVFWDGISKGTKNMIDNANKHKKPVRIIYF